MRAVLYLHCLPEHALIHPRFYTFLNEKFNDAELIDICIDPTDDNLLGPVFEELMMRAGRGEYDTLFSKSFEKICRNMEGCLECVNRCRALGITLVLENECLVIEPENGEPLSLDELTERTDKAYHERIEEIRRRSFARADKESLDKSKGLSQHRDFEKIQAELRPKELGYEGK